MKLSARAKKYIYGSIVLLLWVTTLVVIKNSGVIIGGAPYALIMLFWLWLFSRVTGIKMGFTKSPIAAELEEEREKASLMKIYGISKDKGGGYVYRNKSYGALDAAVNVARLDKYETD